MIFKLEAYRLMLKWSSILIAGLYLCAILSGFVPQIFLSICVLIIIALLMLTEDYYFVYPMMIFYYIVFGTVFGVSVFRIFTILLLVKNLIDTKGIIKKNISFIPFGIYIIYCLFVFSIYNIKTSVFIIISIISVMIIAEKVLSDEEKAKKFFSLYVIAAFCSYFTGIVLGNTMSYNERLTSGISLLNRFMATFEDPNYMGFFFTLGVFATVVLELFSRKIRVCVVVILSIMIMTTLSMTAIIGNILIWFIYLVLKKKINIKTGCLIVAIVIMIVVAYNYRLYVSDVPVLGTLFARIEDKLVAFKQGNMDSVTTGRAKHVEDHLNYFWNQSIAKMLFGGNLANPYVVDLKGLEHSVAHNEYVDLLLNVGGIGTFFMIGYLILTILKHVKNYINSHEALDLCKLIMKLIWLYYAYTLTVFLDFRFMLPYFL